MEIKELLNEIQETERAIYKVNELIEVAGKYKLPLVITASNNSEYRSYADQEFLMEALTIQRTNVNLRLEKLLEAKQVTERVLSGLIAE
ncbi:MULTISPECIES: hypothetical protein [unclassified Pantoea]|uniref:hypothetical protein n=1 Tax=unclassified Pantoea TaxID=2630326 RepID=UPI001CD4C4F4|nr:MULTISPECIES: hypothetical protein [unclassified Pantoea]MCA1178908.1 hypothetical protein [Pantoea sp. alder69]MCA1253779.1 hypothetical protein [Pantoea sp. alder70]MCA1267397.1 hypothetical protein [Pantoea sp. alder81]